MRRGLCRLLVVACDSSDCEKESEFKIGVAHSHLLQIYTHDLKCIETHMITIDTNAGEDAVAEQIEKLKADSVCVERRRLDVGDVLVTANGATVCMERKRWSDLAASICDGRLKEQKSRMLPAEDVTYAYIIEGPLVGWGGSQRGVSHRCMWPALVKTALRDRITVFHTLSPEDTAELCLYVFNQLNTGGLKASAAGLVISGASSKRKRDNLSDPKDVLTAMLCQIPGMSASKAKTIVELHDSVAKLASVDEKELSDIVCGGRKIGPKLSKSIKAVFFQ